ncbi:MAG: glycosyltransferase family 2 protein [Nonlabens sp.]
MEPKVSLVISTYNWPAALELVLLSVFYQSNLPSEVIIADDGSSDSTRRLICSLKDRYDVELRHIWHEDMGHQKTVILNKAIAVASGDYIIQIDGDVILHPHFLNDHMRMAEEGCYLFGSRVNIRESQLHNVLNKKKTRFGYFASGLGKRNRNLHLPFLGKYQNKVVTLSRKLRGCNMSYWKKDFIAVNGYNEDIRGWGAEDSELIQRMANMGIRGKRLKFMGIVYHIYHKELDRSKASFNERIQHESMIHKTVFIPNGVSKYL